MKISKEKDSSSILYLAFVIRMASSALLSSEFGTIFGDYAGLILDFFNAIVIVLLIWKFLEQRYELKQFVILALISILLLISAYYTRNVKLLLTWLFIINSKGIKIRKVAELVLITTVVVVFVNFFFSIFGVIENRLIISDSGIYRYAFGFTNPNVLGAYILQFVCAIYILRNGRMKWKDYLLLGIIFLLMHSSVRSRSMEISLFLLVFFSFESFLPNKYREMVCRGIGKVIHIELLVVIVFSIYNMYVPYYLSPFFTKLDHLISGRLHYVWVYFKRFGVTWFGNPNMGLYNFDTYLDNAYAHLIIIYGISNFFVYIVIIMSLIQNAKRENKIEILTCCFIYIAYGLMEASILDVSRFFVILYGGIFSKIGYKNECG